MSQPTAQRHEQSAIVKDMQKHVNLVAVRLLRSSSQIYSIPNPVPSEWTIDLAVKVGGRKPPEASGVIHAMAGVVASVRGPLDPPGKLVAQIDCEFLLDYKIDNEELYARISDQDVASFSATNGVYNAWPYARAHCQSIAASMMLIIVLPSFRVDLFSDLLPKVQAAAVAAAAKPK